MATAPLAIDYSFSHPTPNAIKAAGYVGVLRYLSLTASKNLQAPERDALFAAGLGILLAWETTTTRATQGTTAGVQDATTANNQADALGYPSTCPIYYAVDENTSWASVGAYFAGAKSVGRRPVKAYGCTGVVVGATQAGYGKGWQTEAWGGTVVSPSAHLYQRLTPTKTISGASAGSYDEDVVVAPTVVWWTAPAPTPVPAPTPTNSTTTYSRVAVVKVPSFPTDAFGWFCTGVALPTGATKTQVVGIVCDDGSPYDQGAWHHCVGQVDYQPVQAGFARVVFKGTPNWRFTARVFVGLE